MRRDSPQQKGKFSIKSLAWLERLTKPSKIMNVLGRHYFGFRQSSHDVSVLQGHISAYEKRR